MQNIVKLFVILHLIILGKAGGGEVKLMFTSLSLIRASPQYKLSECSPVSDRMRLYIKMIRTEK